MATNKTAQFYANLLAKHGAPSDKIPILIAQLAHESANFTDSKIKTHNNPSGITWANSPFQKGATKGNPLPKKETDTKQYYYAKFDNPDAWAVDYLRIINKAPYYALKAANVEDYATRLHNGGYYKDSVINYTNGLKKWLKTYATIQPTPIILIIAIAIAAYFLLK